MIDALRETVQETESRPSEVVEHFPQLTEPQQLRLGSMLKACFAPAWRVGRRMGLSAAQAEENAQEAFMIAARKLDEIRVGCEREFVLGVAVRLASNARRRLSWRMEQLESETDERATSDSLPLAEEVLIRKQERDVLDRILRSMSEVLREVLTLYEIEGFNLPEIAEALDIPEGTATSRLRRARADFCDKLKRFNKRDARVKEET